MPWFVMISGVLLGYWIGFSPHLFVAMAAVCLLLGLLNKHEDVTSRASILHTHSRLRIIATPPDEPSETMAVQPGSHQGAD